MTKKRNRTEYHREYGRARYARERVGKITERDLGSRWQPPERGAYAVWFAGGGMAWGKVVPEGATVLLAGLTWAEAEAISRTPRGPALARPVVAIDPSGGVQRFPSGLAAANSLGVCRAGIRRHIYFDCAACTACGGYGDSADFSEFAGCADWRGFTYVYACSVSCPLYQPREAVGCDRKPPTRVSS